MLVGSLAAGFDTTGAASAAFWRLFAIVISGVCNTELLDTLSASVAEGGRIAIVVVNSNQGLTGLGLDVFDNHGPLATIVFAISARAI